MQGMMQSSSPREQEFQALHLLANVLADPAGYADKIKELDGIHRQIRAATADAQAAQEALKIETEKAHAAVAAAKNEADEHIARRHTQLAVASAAIEQREKD